MGRASISLARVLVPLVVILTGIGMSASLGLYRTHLKSSRWEMEASFHRFNRRAAASSVATAVGSIGVDAASALVAGGDLLRSSANASVWLEPIVGSANEPMCVETDATAVPGGGYVSTAFCNSVMQNVSIVADSGRILSVPHTTENVTCSGSDALLDVDGTSVPIRISASKLQATVLLRESPRRAALFSTERFVSDSQDAACPTGSPLADRWEAYERAVHTHPDLISRDGEVLSVFWQSLDVVRIPNNDGSLLIGREKLSSESSADVHLVIALVVGLVLLFVAALILNAAVGRVLSAIRGRLLEVGDATALNELAITEERSLNFSDCEVPLSVLEALSRDMRVLRMLLPKSVLSDVVKQPQPTNVDGPQVKTFVRVLFDADGVDPTLRILRTILPRILHRARSFDGLAENIDFDHITFVFGGLRSHVNAAVAFGFAIEEDLADIACDVHILIDTGDMWTSTVSGGAPITRASLSKSSSLVRSIDWLVRHRLQQTVCITGNVLSVASPDPNFVVVPIDIVAPQQPGGSLEAPIRLYGAYNTLERIEPSKLRLATDVFEAIAAGKYTKALNAITRSSAPAILQSHFVRWQRLCEVKAALFDTRPYCRKQVEKFV